jgi:hypothetical protein
MPITRPFSDLVTLRDQIMALVRDGDYTTAQQRLAEAQVFVELTPDIENENKRIEWRSNLDKLQERLDKLESVSYGVQTSLITRVNHCCVDTS